MSLLKVISSYNLKPWIFPVVLFVLYGFLTYGNYGYLRYSLNGSYNNSLLSYMVYLRFPISLLLATSLFYNSFYNKKINVLIFKRFWDVLLLFVYILIHSFLTQKFIYPIWFIFTFFGFIKLFTYIRIISLSHFEFFIRVIKIILFAYIFGALLSVFSLPKLIGGTVDIYFSSKTHYSYCIMIVTSLILIVNSIKKQNVSLWEWAFVVCCVLVLLLSGRRTPLIILSLNICIYFLANRKIVIPIVIALSTFFISYDLSDFKTFQRIDRIDYTNSGIDDDSYNVRLILREYYMNEVKNSGYLGVGMGKQDDKKIKTEGLGTHNTYLSVYYQLGFLGLFLWIIIIIKSLFAILRNPNIKQKIIFLMLLLPFFGISWVENTFNPGQIMFQYNLGILILARLLK